MNFKVGDIVAKKNRKLFPDLQPFAVIDYVGSYRGSPMLFFKGAAHKTGYTNLDSYEIISEQERQALVLKKSNIKYAIDENNEDGCCVSSYSKEPKVNYKSELNAYIHAWDMMIKHDGNWLIYNCGKCNGVHIGKYQNTNENNSIRA